MENRKQSNIVRVWCMEDSVGHTPVSDRHAPRIIFKRNPYERECFVDMDRKMLEAELRGSVGFRKLIEGGSLLVKDPIIIKDFNLEDLGEYVKDKEELKEYILNCSMEELEDYLQYAPDTMLFSIETIFSEVELNNRAKIKLIKTYTGVDLETYYKDMDDEGIVIANSKETPKGKQGKKAARKPMQEK